MRTRDFIWVVLAAVLWGGGAVSGAYLTEVYGVHPLSVAMWRMLLAGGALVAVLAAVRALPTVSLGRVAWRRIVVTGLLTAAFEAGYFTAIALTSVGLATLIGIASSPIFVALFDLASGRGRPTPRTLLALAMAVVGLGLLVSGSVSLGGAGAAGALLALVPGACFAGVTVVNRTPVPGLAPAPLTAWAFTVGGVALVPVAALAGWGVPSSAPAWGLALALGLVFTGGAYFAYLSGLRTVPPFVATIVSLLEPLVATLGGVIVFAERLGPVAIVGGVVLGAAVVTLRPQRDAPARAH